MAIEANGSQVGREFRPGPLSTIPAALRKRLTVADSDATRAIAARAGTEIVRVDFRQVRGDTFNTQSVSTTVGAGGHILREREGTRWYVTNGGHKLGETVPWAPISVKAARDEE